MKKLKIYKKDFQLDWPFILDTATIICRDKNILSVEIQGKEYALNGMASMHLKQPDLFKNNQVAEGKSISKIITKALYL